MTTDERKIEINPGAVMKEFAGFGRRWLTVRLPEGMTADDLRDPGIWARVQDKPGKSLNRWDAVLCIAFDESFAVEALVTEANASSVVLSFSKVHSGKQRINPGYTDGTYKLEWRGSGFRILRIADSFEMPDGPFATEAAAITAMHRLHPKRVA